MRVSDMAELLLLAALWGGSFLFMRIAAPSLGPVWLIELRVLLAGLTLLPLVIRLGLWSTLHRNLVPLLITGCINSAIPFLLLAYSSLSLSAGFTAILNATTPLFGTIVAFCWLKEKLAIHRLIGFALSIVGVIVLVGWQPLRITPAFGVAVGAGLFAALSYAIAAPYTRQNLPIPSVVVTTGSQLGAAICILPALPFTVPKTAPSATVLLTVLALALLSTAFAYVLYFRLIQNIGSTKALSVTYLIPLFAMLWGAVFLSEPVTSSMVWGCSLILLGTAIANDLLVGLLRKASC